MRNAFFFFFFTIHEKAMRNNAVFIFLNKTSGRKYIKTIALVSFQHLLRTLPVSYQNDQPFILHTLGASLMNFLPWPKLHHIWKKIQSKCTECMENKWSSRNRCVTWSVHFLNTVISNWKFSENFWAYRAANLSQHFQQSERFRYFA